MTPAEAIDSINFETDPTLQKRDIDGDGKAETCCNFAVKKVADLLKVPLPVGRAAQMLAYIDRLAWRGSIWFDVPGDVARVLADAGRVVVAGWANPDQNRSSHIALCRPTPADAKEIHIGQAGAVNFNDGPLSKGFGKLPVRFWVYAP